VPEWRLIELPDSQAVRLAESNERRLDLYWTEFNTREETDREGMLAFMIRPLESLIGEGEYAVPGLDIEGIDRSWRIVTTIHNHHRGLNPRITRFLATVSGDEETVYLDAHKQNEANTKADSPATAEASAEAEPDAPQAW